MEFEAFDNNDLIPRNLFIKRHAFHIDTLAENQLQNNWSKVLNASSPYKKFLSVGRVRFPFTCFGCVLPKLDVCLSFSFPLPLPLLWTCTN